MAKHFYDFQVEKALTSPVPGTTLNLLKFPIMRPGIKIVHFIPAGGNHLTTWAYTYIYIAISQRRVVNLCQQNLVVPQQAVPNQVYLQVHSLLDV